MYFSVLSMSLSEVSGFKLDRVASEESVGEGIVSLSVVSPVSEATEEKGFEVIYIGRALLKVLPVLCKLLSGTSCFAVTVEASNELVVAAMSLSVACLFVEGLKAEVKSLPKVFCVFFSVFSMLLSVVTCIRLRVVASREGVDETMPLLLVLEFILMVAEGEVAAGEVPSLSLPVFSLILSGVSGPRLGPGVECDEKLQVSGSSIPIEEINQIKLHVLGTTCIRFQNLAEGNVRPTNGIQVVHSD